MCLGHMKQQKKPLKLFEGSGLTFIDQLMLISATKINHSFTLYVDLFMKRVDLNQCRAI